jgi:hypothetical protein
MVRFGQVVDSEAYVPNFIPQHVAVTFWHDPVEVFDPTFDGPVRVRRVGVADVLGDDDALCSDAGSGHESGDDADENIDFLQRNYTSWLQWISRHRLKTMTLVGPR